MSSALVFIIKWARRDWLMWKVVEIWEQLQLVPCSIFVKTKTMVTSFLHPFPTRAATQLVFPIQLLLMMFLTIVPDPITTLVTCVLYTCSLPSRVNKCKCSVFLQHLVVHSLSTVCVVLSESLICLFRPNGDPWRDDMFLGDIIGVCSVKSCCCHAIMSVAIITTITFYFTTWIVL